MLRMEKHHFNMKKEEEIKIHHLHSQNKLFLTMDFLESLATLISESNPNKKWSNIAKELNGINLDLVKVKTFYNRIFQEMEIQSELNLIIKKFGADELLKGFKDYKRLEKEVDILKKNIK